MSVRTTPAVLGYGSAMAVVLAAFNYTGGKLSGYVKDPEVDEVGRKEYMRRNRRRPFEETVEQLGEGRGEPQIQGSNTEEILIDPAGIFPPGYDERRAQRLKERYNFDVPTPRSAAP